MVQQLEQRLNYGSSALHSVEVTWCYSTEKGLILITQDYFTNMSGLLAQLGGWAHLGLFTHGVTA